MEFSTTLPPGFTTWNKLWNKIKDSRYVAHMQDYCIYYETPAIQHKYLTKDIKARAFDENQQEKRIYTEKQVRDAFIAGMEFIPVHPDYYERDADDYIKDINILSK